MKIPKLFFNDTLTDWLHALFFQGECIGAETLSVSWNVPLSLNIPLGTQYALIVVEAAPTSIDKSRVIRFREDGSNPDARNGIPLGDLGVYEVKGKENMLGFRAIGIQAFLIHTLQIQYFG